MENNFKENKIVIKKKGVVVGMKSNKTIMVSVDTLKTHPKYKKKYTATKRYKVHSEDEKINVGDVVDIIPTRPMSKDKKYKIA